MMYPEQYRNDQLIQALMKNNVLDQLLYAFDPGMFRQTPQPLPLYDPNQQAMAGQGGGSYLDQLLAQTQAAQAPAAAPQMAAPLQQIMQQADPYRKVTNDFEDRYGVAYSRKYGM
jgi:hypothetical protein